MEMIMVSKIWLSPFTYIITSKNLEKHNLYKYLNFGGRTPQQQAEHNNFDSILDFSGIIEGVILKIKSK